MCIEAALVDGAPVMIETLESLKTRLDTAGMVPLSAIRPSAFESAFLNRALIVEPGQSLFHYMRVDRFKDLLRAGAIYMRRLDLFQMDPHEGKFPSANARELSSLARGVGSQLGLGRNPLDGYRHFQEGKMRELTYVHSWFAWDKEDPRMWKEYGDCGGGVCIRTTARRLREALTITRPHFWMDISGVSYVGDEEPIPEVMSFMAVCRKRPQFAHEQEVRLIGQLDTHGWQECGGTTPDHQLINANFERLFERVYIGPNASPVTFNELRSLANQAAGSKVVCRSTVPDLGMA
jgi:hypothetical protein